MKLELAISLRYFRSRRGEGALSFITWVAIGGVAIGVASLVVAMSVMNGYQTNLVQAMAGALPHLSIYGLSTSTERDFSTIRPLLRDYLQPETISEYALHETLVSAPHSAGRVRGVIVRAIDIDVERKVPAFLTLLQGPGAGWPGLPLAERLSRAATLVESLGQAPAPGVVPALIGRGLAAKLRVDIGERLTPLVFTREGHGLSPQPEGTFLEVRGLVNSGVSSLDDALIIIPLHLAGEAFPGQPLRTALGVRLHRPLEAADNASWLRAQMRQLEWSGYVYTWVESNRGLLEIILLQKTMLFLVLLLIVVLAFFGMITALVMLVTEKTRDITILKSLGLRGRLIHHLFMIQGLLIGLSGTALGLGLGLAVCWALDTFPIFEIPPGVYPGSDRVPVLVSGLDLALVVGATMLACGVATLFPARKALSIHPVEGLRKS